MLATKHLLFGSPFIGFVSDLIPSIDPSNDPTIFLFL